MGKTQAEQSIRTNDNYDKKVLDALLYTKNNFYLVQSAYLLL